MSHGGVPGPAGLEAGHPVHVEAFEKLSRIGTLHVDLAKGRGIHDPDAGPDRTAFPRHRVVHRLPRPGEIPGPLPLTNVLEHRAQRGMRRMNRRRPNRIEPRTDRSAGHRPERYRLDRRPGARRPPADRRAKYRSGDRGGVHLGGPALFDTGAGQGIALEVLDRLNPGAQCPNESGHGHVAVEVHERTGLVPIGRGHMPKLRGRSGAKPREVTGCGADYSPPRHAVHGHERADPVVPAGGGAQLMDKVDRRVPASRDGEGVAREADGGASVADRDGREPSVAIGVGSGDDRASQDRDLRGASPRRQFTGKVPARVDHGHHRPARRHQIDRGAVGIVVGGEHHRALRRQGKLVEVGPDRRGQHHPGAVVVGEDHGPLECSGRDHDLPGPNLPEPAFGPPDPRGSRQVAAHPFHQHDTVLIEPDHRRRPAEDPDLGLGA